MHNDIKFFLPLLLLVTFIASQPHVPALSTDQIKTIGNKIWKNEGSQKKERLTWWNKGEPCASMGIGHFIWYPEKVPQQFSQTFPDLLVFLKNHGVTLPSWLQENPKKAYCPWHSYEEFFAHANDAKMIELRELLVSTIDLQMHFIIERASRVLDKMIDAVSTKKQKNHIKKEYNLMTHTPNGMYALIDYHNFKGDGTNPKERYNNQGWGLLQILERMDANNDDTVIIENFVNIATDLLEQRVKNAPTSQNEQRFLAGWKQRIKNYLEPL